MKEENKNDIEALSEKYPGLKEIWSEIGEQLIMNDRKIAELEQLFIKKMEDNSVDLDKDISDMVDEHFDELL